MDKVIDRLPPNQLGSLSEALQSTKSLNQAIESINQVSILLVKALDESTKNECDQIAAGSVSKESKKKIATYNKILLEPGCR